MSIRFWLRIPTCVERRSVAFRFEIRVNCDGKCGIVHPCLVRSHCQLVFAVSVFCDELKRNVLRGFSVRVVHIRRRNAKNCFSGIVFKRNGAVLFKRGSQFLGFYLKFIWIGILFFFYNDIFFYIVSANNIFDVHSVENICIAHNGWEIFKRRRTLVFIKILEWRLSCDDGWNIVDVIRCKSPRDLVFIEFHSEEFCAFWVWGKFETHSRSRVYKAFNVICVNGILQRQGVVYVFPFTVNFIMNGDFIPGGYLCAVWENKVFGILGSQRFIFADYPGTVSERVGTVRRNVALLRFVRKPVIRRKSKRRQLQSNDRKQHECDHSEKLLC